MLISIMLGLPFIGSLVLVVLPDHYAFFAGNPSAPGSAAALNAGHSAGRSAWAAVGSIGDASTGYAAWKNDPGTATLGPIQLVGVGTTSDSAGSTAPCHDAGPIAARAAGSNAALNAGSNDPGIPFAAWAGNPCSAGNYSVSYK